MPDGNETDSGAVTLSASDQRLLAAARQHNLGADDLEAMVAQRNAVAAQSRSLRIRSIVQAMEGRGEDPLITQVVGRRHYPVVVAAVEKALRESPTTLALSATDTGETDLDRIVADVVNAIPAESREPVLENVNRKPVGAGAGDGSKPTPEELDEVARRARGGGAAKKSRKED